MTTYRIVEIVEQAIPDVATAERRLVELRAEKGLTGERAALMWVEAEHGLSEMVLAARELRAIRASLDRLRTSVDLIR